MFNKTTILPVEDVALAKELFQRLIHEEAKILLIVLGSDMEAKTTVERASKLAGLDFEPHWVVWIRNPAPLEDDIMQLKGAQDAIADLSSTRLFALNFSDVVKDVIRIDEGIPDFTRIQLAWMNAEEL